MDLRVLHAISVSCVVALLASCQEQPQPQVDNGSDHLVDAWDLWQATQASYGDQGYLGFIAMPGEAFADSRAEVDRQREFAEAKLADLERDGFFRHLERFAEAREFRPAEQMDPGLPSDARVCGSLARPLRARMVQAWRDHDWDKAAHSFDLAVSVSNRMLEDELSPHAMLGHAIHMMMLDEASAIVLQGGVPENELASLRESLGRSLRMDVLSYAESVRTKTHRELDQMFLSDSELRPEGFEGGFIDRIAGKPDGWHLTASNETKPQATQRTDVFIDRWIAEHRALLRNGEATFDPYAYVDNLGEDNTISLISIMTAHGTIVSGMRMQMSADALLLNLALAQFHHRTGVFPERIQQLVPHELSHLPIDPLSGRAYGYFKRRPEVPSVRDKPYEIYSVGDDHTDNLGRFDWTKPGRAVQSVRIAAFDRKLGFTPPDYRHYDYPLNRPD